jgi:hypothetical protein
LNFLTTLAGIVLSFTPKYTVLSSTIKMPKCAGSVHRCGFCGKRLPTLTGVRLHIQNTNACRRRWELQVTKPGPSTKINETQATPPANIPTHLEADFSGAAEESVPLVDVSLASEDSFPNPEHLERFFQLYPEPVAAIVGKEKTVFERWEDERRKEGRSQWYPFESKDEWELAAWLAQNVGHNKIDEFLKLAEVSI